MSLDLPTPLKLEFDLVAVPYTRARLCWRNNKAHVYNTSKYSKFKNIVAFRTKRQLDKDFKIIKDPVSINCLFEFRKAKSCRTSEHTKAPDLSNLIKAIEDSLNKIVYVDDKQIVEIKAKKQYSDRDKITVIISKYDKN